MTNVKLTQLRWLLRTVLYTLLLALPFVGLRAQEADSLEPTRITVAPASRR